MAEVRSFSYTNRPAQNKKFFLQRQHAKYYEQRDKEVYHVDKPPKEMLLTEALVKWEWSLAGIDKGVKGKFLELFVKAGRTYVRIL
jgi:hypothetical protein